MHARRDGEAPTQLQPGTAAEEGLSVWLHLPGYQKDAEVRILV